MIQRAIAPIIKKRAGKMPVISITGPRQSGKTTLVKALFPDYKYISLENLLNRENASADPLDFLKRNGPKVILDEVQHVPELFSYIQVLVDESGKMGEYILTGSQHFLLMEKISQSLAGRVAIFNLLPFSIAELRATDYHFDDYEEYLWRGQYPPLYDRELTPLEWLPEYIETYVERDLRQLINVSDLSMFRKFLRLCAGHTGQLVNFSSMAGQLGMSYQTVKKWLSILETSYVLFSLQPHYVNYNKRLVKRAKLYFHDTGLACFLLGIKNKEELSTHYLKGALFENLIISEIAKTYYNNALRPELFFWRDHTGNEVDLIIEKGKGVKAVEFKSAKTIHSDFFKGLNFYRKLSSIEKEDAFIVYGGNESFSRPQAEVLAWHEAVGLASV